MARTVERPGRGYAWLDTGTHESLLEASEFVRTLEKRTGQKTGCIEEVAFRMGFIDALRLKKLARLYSTSDYGEYSSGCWTREGSGVSAVDSLP